MEAPGYGEHPQEALRAPPLLRPLGFLWTAPFHRSASLHHLAGLESAGTLLLATLAFLDSEHAEPAVSFGWDEVALFGVHPCSEPRHRLEGWGLVPTLGWSVLRLSIRTISADHVALVSANAQGGSELTFRRKPGLASAVPWWRHPVLSGVFKDAK